MTGMPFFDVAVFNDAPTPRAIFHTLVHITTTKFQMMTTGW